MPSSNAALDHKSQRVAIPKKIHYIWIGGTIPSEYAKGIEKTVTACPKFDVNLWVSKTMSSTAKDYAKNVAAGERAGATVRHIDTELVKEHYTATEKWAQTLEFSWTDGKKGAKKPNFGAVSDIVRSVLLAVEGGVYVDTDCSVNKEFNGFSCKVPFGFQAATGSENNPTSPKPSNCVMISIQNGRFINAYRKYINDKYGEIKKSNLSQSELVKRFRGKDGYESKHVEEKTLFMTGPVALACCAEALTVGGKDVGHKLFTDGCGGGLKDIAIAKKGYFSVRYDNSWL